MDHRVDCCWVGSLDYNFLGNQGAFHYTHKKLNTFCTGVNSKQDLWYVVFGERLSCPLGFPLRPTKQGFPKTSCQQRGTLTKRPCLVGESEIKRKTHLFEVNMGGNSSRAYGTRQRWPLKQNSCHYLKDCRPLDKVMFDFLYIYIYTCRN